MTQKEAVLDMLSRKEWICSTEFQENYLPEFRSLIARMRKHEGYLIVDEACLGRCGKTHKSKGLKRWQWVRKNLNGELIKQTHGLSNRTDLPNAR